MTDQMNNQGAGAQQPAAQPVPEAQPATQVVPETQPMAQAVPEAQPAAAQAAPEAQPVTTAQPAAAQAAPEAQPTAAYQQAYQTAPQAAPGTAAGTVPPATPGATAAVPPAAYPAPGVPQPSPTPALVCGILSIVLCGAPLLGIVLGIVAIVLAGKYFKAGGTQGTAKGGRICGIIGIVASVLMTILCLVLVFGTFNALSSYEAATSATSPSRVEASSSSNASAYTPTGDDEEDAQAAAAAKLESIKDRDPQTMQVIADMVQASFDEAAAYSDEDLTLARLGIDPKVLAEKLVQDFDYEPFYTSIDSSDPDEAEADFDVTYRRFYDAFDEFQDLLTDFMASGDYAGITSEDQAYKKIGELLLQAVDNVEPTETGFVELDVVREGDTWTVTEDSWDDELDYLFALI